MNTAVYVAMLLGASLCSTTALACIAAIGMGY